MTPITFTAYSGFGREVCVIAERITHFYPIDYNGNHGTMLVLDTGKEVCVADWPSAVKMAIDQVTVKP